MHKSIKHKLIVSFLSVTALMFVTSIVLAGFNMHLTNRFKGISTLLVSEGSLYNSTKELIRSYYYLAVDIDSAQKEAVYGDHREKIRQTVMALDDRISQGESRVIWRGVKNVTKVIMNKCEDGVTLVRKGVVTQTSDIFEEANHISNYLRNDIARLLLTELLFLEASQKDLQKQQKIVLLVTISLLVLITLLCVVLGVTFSQKIILPLTSFAKVAAQAAEGDLNVSIDKSFLAAHDEVGILSRSFEVMLRNLNAKMSEVSDEKDKFITLFESSYDAILIMQGNVFVQCNQQALRVFACEDRDIIGASPWTFSPEKQLDGELSREKGMMLVRTALEGSGDVFEWMHQRKNGEEFIAEVSLSKIALKGEDLVQVIVRDVSDRKRLERELNQARKLESIGTLAAGVAHEINTPTQFIGDNTRFIGKCVSRYVKALHGYQEYMRNPSVEGAQKVKQMEDELQLDFLQKEVFSALAEADGGIERIAKIVAAMKDYSHVGHDEKVATDINRLLDSTILVSSNAWKYVARVTKNFGRNIPTIACYHADVSQACMNIIINATHAIEDKRGKMPKEKGAIRVKTYATDTHVGIAISDDGVGIPQKVQESIFDPFFTTKTVGRGTGQGLSIVYSTIVEKHHGHLWFETEEGKGTTFFIELPI